MRKLYYLLIFIFSFSVLSAQEKLTKEEQARREKNIQAGNPFAKYGYKAKVATLSKGKYLEFHDLDSIVTIGTMRWHVDKNQIVGRIEIDTLNPDAQPIGDAPGRWMSPDPLSEEFPSYSPYNFCYNNPMRFTDPTGMAPDDWVKCGNTWSYEASITTAEQAKEAGYDDFKANGSVLHNARIGSGEKGDVYLGANGQAAYDESTYGNWLAVHGSEYDNAFERFRSWQVDTKEHIGESTSDRNLRLGAGFAHEASREYGSGGYNMFSGLFSRFSSAIKSFSAEESILSSSEYLRIENAATRIGQPITVVGSRASGTAGAFSDWDYVIENLSSKNWSKIKNSLPGAKSVIDNTPRNIDVFNGPVNTSKPFITIAPR